MAVAVDVVTTSAVSTSVNSGTSATTGTVTVSANAKLALAFITQGLQGITDANITGTGTFTFGGQTMTALSSGLIHSGNNATDHSGWVEVFYLLNPPTGAGQSATWAPTYTGAAGNGEWILTVVTYTGTDGVTIPTVVTDTSNGENVSSRTLTATLATGDMLAGVAGNGTAAPTVTTGTQDQSITGSAFTGCHNLNVAHNTGSGSVSIVWSTNSGDFSGATGVKLTAASTSQASPAPAYRPGPSGDPDWQWQQQFGNDPAPAAPTVPNLSWQIQGNALPPPNLPDFVTEVLDPSRIETVPVPRLVQGSALPPPPAPVQLFTALDPSRVETVPVPQLIPGRALPPPAITVQVIPGLNPSQVETVPVPVLVQAVAPPPPPISVQIVAGLDPNRVETVPVFVTVQSSALPPPAIAVRVQLGLTPGTPPATTSYASFVQGAALPPPAIAVRVALGLTPGTPPVTIYYTAIVQGAALPPPSISAQAFSALNPQQFRTAPTAIQIAATAPTILPPPQQVFPPGLDPQRVDTVRGPILIRREALPPPRPERRVWVALTPGTPPPVSVVVASKPYIYRADDRRIYVTNDPHRYEDTGDRRYVTNDPHTYRSDDRRSTEG